MRKRFGYCLFVLAAIPVSLRAEPDSAIYSSGPVFSCASGGEVQSGHDTVDGEIVVMPAQEADSQPQLYASEFAPAQVGISFGFFACQPAPETTVTLRGTVRHPPMVHAGKTVTEQSWPIVLPVKREGHADEEVCSYIGYRMEDAYELVAGDWVFSLWKEDLLVLSETVTVVETAFFPFTCELT